MSTTTGNSAAPSKRRIALFVFRRLGGLVVVLLVVMALLALVPGAFGHGLLLGFPLGIVTLVASALLTGRLMRDKRAAQLPPPPIPSTTWDYAMSLTDLEGHPVTFERDLRTVLVLNFWATWCGPCVAEMPAFERLVAKLSHMSVRFAFISREEGAVVQQFLNKRGLALPVYLLAGEPPASFTIRGIPATFVIDKTGRVALHHTGVAAWDDESVVTFIAGLAATPA